MAMAWDLSFKKDIADRSAPAAKINGLPVTAIATASDFCASSIADASDASEAAPKVLGRL